MRDVSRRDLIVGSVVYGSSLWLLLNLPRPLAARAAQESTRPLVLGTGEWKIVEAITARIIPTDHEPGAVEAGCVNFIDKALAHEDAAMKPVYRAGFVGIDAVSRKRFAAPFVKLGAEQQDEVLAALESGDAGGWPANDVVPPAKFFEAVRAHTIIGFLADPKYGGNRDYAGWKVVGYPGGRPPPGRLFARPNDRQGEDHGDLAEGHLIRAGPRAIHGMVVEVVVDPADSH